MAEHEQIEIPDIGDFRDVPVIEILVGEGDTVDVDSALLTLESDKASMDVPSPIAGTVRRVLVKTGDKVSQGTAVALIEPAGPAGGEKGGTGSLAEEVASIAAELDMYSPPASSGTREPSPGRARVEPAVGKGTGSAIEAASVQAVPDIGDFEDVEIIEVHIAPGDTVALEDPLVTLESDKATMDVPATAAGRITEVFVQVGDRVSQGSPIADLLGGAEAPPAAAPGRAPPPPSAAAVGRVDVQHPAPPPTLPPPMARTEGAKPHAGPSVRRFARELGVDLSLVAGTGRKQRILKQDVQAYVKQRLGGPASVATAEPAAGAAIPPIPEVDFNRFGEVETRPLPRIKKLSRAHLHRCWLNVPHVTHHDEADITDLEDFRRSLREEAERRGLRLTLLAFVMKALAAALKEFPQFNASLGTGGDTLVYKKYCHVGVAVDTPNGLVVPVFRDVDRKGVYELATEMGEISARAREGKLRPEEMQGGCISISSLGGIGGTAFTPIVNAPEVAILGLTRSRMTPVWNGNEFLPRLLLPMDLSYDHRVIDGAEAARFLAFLGALLADTRRLLL